MGFFDDLEKGVRFQAAINASKDSTGKPNPYAAAGIVMGMGKGYSLKDAAMLGTTRPTYVLAKADPQKQAEFLERLEGIKKSF